MALSIKNLSKKFSNAVVALDNVTLDIPNGMFGLLGPNGAGKSTLMRILATLLEADSGEVFLDKLNVLQDKDAVRQILGYLPQEFGVYPRIDAGELLMHIALLKGINNASERRQAVDYLLNQTNLYEHRNKRINTFSGGMKQRFGIAQALLGNPSLIIVDEPTAGLDPIERNRFLNLLGEIGENLVVILSTHIVEDVKEMCSNMAILNKGRIEYQGSTSDALLIMKDKIWSKLVQKTELKELSQQYEMLSTRMQAGKPLIHIYNEEPMNADWQSVAPNLEDFYFKKLKTIQN
jgi:ABC-type multidrug transport system ATPase subunit